MMTTVFLSLLRPVFHPVHFEEQQKPGIPCLLELAALRVVQDSSMCQQARFLVPSSLIEDLARIALLQGRDRSLVQLLKGWSSSSIILKQFIPGFFQGRLLFHNYEMKRACAQRARELLKVLITALVESAPQKLVHVDFTGFFVVNKFFLWNVFGLKKSFEKTIKQLRAKGLKVTLDTIDYHKITNLNKENFSRAVHVDDLFNSQLDRILSCAELDLSLVIYISLPGGVQAKGVPDLLHKLNLIAQLQNLQAMELSDLKATFRGELTEEENRQVVCGLQEMFKGLQKLSRLDIRSSIPSEGGGFALLSSSLLKLEYLNLSYNTLSSSDISSLATLTNLKHLDVSGCKVGAGTSEVLRKVLGQIHNLQVLEAESAANLINLGAHQLLRTLRGCSRLEVLVLQCEVELDHKDLLALGLRFLLVTKLGYDTQEDAEDYTTVVREESGYRLETKPDYIRATRLEYCVPDHITNDPYLMYKQSQLS